MKITELNRNQLQEVKCYWYDNYLAVTKNEFISLYELANIDNYVSDEKIFQELKDYDFTDNDFVGTASLIYGK